MMKMLSILLLVIGWSAASPAIPAFSRQTGASCRLCHFLDMHSLNKYGRDFLINGYRETDKMKERRKKIEKERQRREAGGE